MTQTKELRSIRIWLSIFIAGLVLSGISAFPLQTELDWLNSQLRADAIRPITQSSHLLPWIELVDQALRETNARYPFLAYGTDWLAFAHLVIAIAFVGAILDPVRNKWLITFGLIACAGVIPLAMIAGALRGIPFPWRLIDCSFGVFGSIPLLICRKLIVVLELRESAVRVREANVTRFKS
jgi:hypothetical protein